MTCRAPGLAGTLMRGHQRQSLRYRTWELSDLNRGAGESRTQFGRLSPLADQDRPPHTPRGLHGCENKEVARQGICKYVKTKGGCGWQAPSAQRKKGRFFAFGLRRTGWGANFMSYGNTKWVYCQEKYIYGELLVRTDRKVVGGASVTPCLAWVQF